MQNLFLTVLEINLATSAMILILLIISPLLAKRYTAKLQYFVLLVIAIRLLIPINMPWEHSLRLNFFAHISSNTAQVEAFIPNQIVDIDDDLNAEDARGQARYGLLFPTTTLGWVSLAWASGSIAFLLYHLCAYRYTLRQLRRWSTPVTTKRHRHANFSRC